MFRRGGRNPGRSCSPQRIASLLVQEDIQAEFS